MASLKRRGKIWYGQYYVGGRPERISLKTTSLQIAKEKLRQIESALARREDIPLPTHGSSFLSRITRIPKGEDVQMINRR